MKEGARHCQRVWTCLWTMREGWGGRQREEGIVANRDLQQRGEKERGQWHSVTESYTHSHALVRTHTHKHTHSVSSVSLTKRVSQPVSRLFLCECVCLVGMLTRAHNHPSSLWPTVRSFHSLWLFDRLCHFRPSSLLSFPYFSLMIVFLSWLWFRARLRPPWSPVTVCFLLRPILSRGGQN